MISSSIFIISKIYCIYICAIMIHLWNGISIVSPLHWIGTVLNKGFPFAVILKPHESSCNFLLSDSLCFDFHSVKGLLLKICLANRHPLTLQYLAVLLSLWLFSFIDGWSLNTVVNRALISWNYCYKTMLMLFEFGWLSSFTASFDKWEQNTLK